MLPIQHITVHHDALDYESFARSDARQRMLRVQSAHQVGNGWADIGYHFVIDRSGNVWEGRPLQWQGAHVKDRNEGNIGVMLMGNFEVQRPSSAQVEAVGRFVPELQATHRVPRANVRSHREWDGASTLCPGRFLQARLDRLRSERAFG